MRPVRRTRLFAFLAKRQPGRRHEGCDGGSSLGLRIANRHRGADGEELTGRGSLRRHWRHAPHALSRERGLPADALRRSGRRLHRRKRQAASLRRRSGSEESQSEEGEQGGHKSWSRARARTLQGRARRRGVGRCIGPSGARLRHERTFWRSPPHSPPLSEIVFQ